MITTQWLIMYELAKDFFKEYNDLLIPQRYERNNKKLGQWISDQRTLYKRGKLLKEKITLLEEIDMTWDASKYRGTSLPEQILYFYIKQYFPNAINTYSELGYELDVFIPELKLAFEYDGAIHAKEEKKDILKNIKCKENNIFLIRIREKECKKLDYAPDNFIQFKLYHRFNKSNEFEEYNKLLELIFDYINSKFNLTIKYEINISKDIDKIMDFYKKSISLSWENSYKKLKEWYIKNNNLIIPKDYKVNGISLEKWLKRQRINYRRGLLTKHQIRSLENLKISWEPYDDLWYNNYLLLKEYKQEYGNINKIKYKDKYKEQNLGSWLFKQRQAYNGTKDRRKMTEERIRFLEDLGIIWNLPENDWNNHYEYIKNEYIKGNTQFRTDFITEDGFKPSVWITKQRTLYKKGKLSDERKNKLKNIHII